MKKQIAILGSTGSIGKNTFDILLKDNESFEIVLLTSNGNINEIIKQTKKFKVKNIIISNKQKYYYLKKKLVNKKINIYNNLESINKIFTKKIDYCMCAISGLEGLKSTLDMIKFSKTIAVANKESLICGWNLIYKELKKNKTKFIPVDSEHFSIWTLLKGSKLSNVEKIIITASGGPFLNTPIKKFNNITPKTAMKHPNWNMGNKISIDSATLMNKVFEIIEAQRIFNLDLSKFEILTHPKSYVHAIIKFYNGLTKILIHDTDMRIPIMNSIYDGLNFNSHSNELDINILNDLNFKKVNKKKFLSIKILDNIPKSNSLFETVIISANDELVYLFLARKIKFPDIVKKLIYIIKLKEFNKYKLISPKNFNEIKTLNNYVRLKVQSLCI
jgi:1-deoxy-D-xylulose-5-phosphate reductoisomerase